MAASDSTQIKMPESYGPEIRAFITDTLAPYFGAPRAVTQSDVPFIFAPEGDMLYRPFGQKVTERTNAPYRDDTRRTLLVHEFAHLGQFSPEGTVFKGSGTMEVPMRIWTSVLTPEQRRAWKEDPRSGPGGRNWVKESFAYLTDETFETLDLVKNMSEEQALRIVSSWTSDDKARRYLFARFLTRRDSPFANHPHRKALLKRLRSFAQRGNNNEGD